MSRALPQPRVHHHPRGPLAASTLEAARCGPCSRRHGADAVPVSETDPDQP